MRKPPALVWGQAKKVLYVLAEEKQDRWTGGANKWRRFSVASFFEIDWSHHRRLSAAAPQVRIIKCTTGGGNAVLNGELLKNAKFAAQGRRLVCEE